MALANHTDLLAAVAAWLNRTDLTATIPDFITLAEREFNRKLRTIEMEVRANVTATGGVAALPADFLGLRSISIDNTALDPINPGEAFDDDTTGDPIRYSIADGQIFLRPAPASKTVSLAYYQTIPALTAAAPTNWLMTKHPDLYLFGTCAQAEWYLVNDDRVERWKARTEELIQQINEATGKERYGGARLRMRARVSNIGIAA